MYGIDSQSFGVYVIRDDSDYQRRLKSATLGPCLSNGGMQRVSLEQVGL